MVWLDSGAERLPAVSNDFVTTISLRGASYNVYTKNDDERYIAFVAQDPVNSGSVVSEIFWGAANFDLLEWTITQRQ